MKRIKIGDVVQTDYGKGRVKAVTNEWFIHDNSLEGRNDEYAILMAEDLFEIMFEPALETD